MRFKPGEMAVIKRPWKDGKHIGLPVTIVRLGQRGEIVQARNGGLSECDGPDGGRDFSLGWLCDSNRDDFPLFVDDACLRKIHGDETDEQSLEAMRDLMQTKKEKATT